MELKLVPFLGILKPRVGHRVRVRVRVRLRVGLRVANFFPPEKKKSEHREKRLKNGSFQ